MFIALAMVIVRHVCACLLFLCSGRFL